jgi:hypothetical protein
LEAAEGKNRETLMIRHALVAVGVTAFASSALAETISVPFTTPDGGVTAGLYDGTVRVTVSGVGQSLGTQLNDAFYVYTDGAGSPITPFNDPDYYQLTFGTTTLVPFDPAQDAKNFLVGPLPAYASSHIYSFELNTGVSVPTALHFGVSDGDFADNSGSYTISVSQVPEASTWAMMLAGFAGLGYVAFSRRRTAQAVA